MVKSTLFAKLPDYVSTPDGMTIDSEGNLILLVLTMLTNLCPVVF